MLVVVLVLLQRSTVHPSDLWDKVAFFISAYDFDYISWEVQALAQKAHESLFGIAPFIPESERIQIVRDYFTSLAYVHQLEAQIDAAYTDPAIHDPFATTTELRAERDDLRAELTQQQSLVEAILEGQVAAVLVEQGFGVAGQLLPPMAMHFTQSPNVLVISPRDAIRFEISLSLFPLPVDKRAEIEEAIDARFEVSSLIVPTGGIALYPAMIQETANLPFAIETFAHEWLHHYLYVFPLGISYFTGDAFAGEARIINETTADLFGKEVGRLVLERYYPDLVPPPPPPIDENAPLPLPPVFDYGAAMHETRVTVDALLAEGKIEEAEAYMEERRRLFVENGYPIRKLNQAFFAFYGGYQTGIPGVAGEDPIGPALQAIRAASPSLHDFIWQVRTITTRAELLALKVRLSGQIEP
ncbi:MAG: hypothetical protein D6712_00320 [Chloroflexi bacterium]|nr:MAG: hypothetical protein D6712_00320 [Chloroflexota bacterium]